MESLFLTSEAAERHPDFLVERARSVSEAELAGLAASVTPQGVVAVCRTVDVGLDLAVGPEARLVVCAVEVRDPGNAGTLIRTADAFGADAVILTSGSVDVYNPKTVRASVGSLFHVPVVVGASAVEAVARAKGRGLQVLAADGAGDVRLDRLTAGGGLAAPTLWLFGTEAHGLSAHVAATADARVSVPIFGAAESLNLGSAAAICLYASAVAQQSSRRAPARGAPHRIDGVRGATKGCAGEVDGD